MYILQFDGSFRDMSEYGGNAHHAGFMGFGWLIFKDEQLAARGMGVFACAECANASIAEYLALIEGLDALYDMGVRDEPVEIRGDAKSVINQMDDSSRVCSPLTLSQYQRAKELSTNFSQISWSWVPREANRAADALTRQALRRMHSSNYYQKLLRKLDTPPDAPHSSELVPVIDLRVFQPAW